MKILNQFGQSNPTEQSVIEGHVPGTPFNALGTTLESALEDFEDWLETDPSQQCGENVTGISDISKALLRCRELYKVFSDNGTGDLSEDNWSSVAVNELNTYSANSVDNASAEGFKFEDDDDCFTTCPGNEHPSYSNTIWRKPVPGINTEECPDCEDVKHVVDSALATFFPEPQSITAENSYFFEFDFSQKVLSSIYCSKTNCEPQPDSTEYIYIDPQTGTVESAKVSTTAVEQALATTLSGLYDNMSEYCKSKVFSHVPNRPNGCDSFSQSDSLLMRFSKCLPFFCGSGDFTGGFTKIPQDTTDTINPPEPPEPSVGCCSDTTKYKDMLLPFLEDFKEFKNFMGNQFAFSFPSSVGSNHPNYVNTPLYDGYCPSSLKVKVTYNEMPYRQMVLEDECGDRFILDLKYIKQYNPQASNQMNYSWIVDFDSIAVRGFVDGNCQGTSQFLAYGKQHEYVPTDIFNFVLFGEISDYQLISSYPKIGDSCDRDAPKLCNRAYGTISHVIPSPCKTWKKMRAATYAKVKYEAYLDSLQDDFKQKYYNTCMGARDSMDMDYELKEYHYTLYYYDQAGNLTQTVPPAGVQFMDKSTFGIIAKAKRNIGQPIYPNHSLVTRYRYNSLNEVRWQETPDGGQSNFWYDRLGRMAVSQNAEQINQAIKQYSYTYYDSLGRISEVGQLSSTVSMTKEKAFSQVLLTDWHGNTIKEQITRTWYDIAPTSIYLQQHNLRGRVAAMAYFISSDSNYKHAVHYDYDIHGNVKTLVREITDLHIYDQGYKEISYDYDLVSGNVNKVYYQQGKDDQFTHRYIYDDDNRLTDVFTSSDGIHWDKDAAYEYYLHGPLKRTTLGELNVQGIDYAYTIHGWLKAVNGNNLIAETEIGQDGYYDGQHSVVAQDVFGFSLHYYDDDYRSINGHTDASSPAAQSFLIRDKGSAFSGSVRQLYNGNISRMVTALDKLGANAVVGRAYEYDQLNRISKALTYDIKSNNAWSTTGNANADYYSDYTYDANGNILTLNRNAGGATAMDQLTYHYIPGTNQLEYVDDIVGASVYGHDIDDQQAGNYTYDSIGNLTSDVSEEIASIEWTVYGKIQSITRTVGSSKPSLNFEYTPDGHRVAKHVTDSSDKTTSTWYVRDASGNIMSTYVREWLQPEAADIAVIELYDQLVLDHSYTSRLTFLDQKINWITGVSAPTLTTLETDVRTSALYPFLGAFDPMPYLNSTNTNLIYNAISDRLVIDLLSIGGSISDQDLYDIQFQNNGLELLTDQISQDYVAFLQNLQTLQPMAHTDLCTTLGLSPGATPAAIMAVSTASLTASIIHGLPYTAGDMSIYMTIYDIVIGLNQPNSWDFFGNLPSGKSVWMNYYGWNWIAQTMTNFYGYTNTWQKLFAAQPSTEAARISDIRQANEQVFLYVAMQKLNDPAKMRTIVSNLTGQTVEQWLLAIEQHYGTMYTNELKEAVGYISIDPYWQYKLAESHIYGSSRVGLVERNLPLLRQVAETDSVIYFSYTTDSIQTMNRGEKRYELSNHLGNVLAVITDRRIQSCDIAGVSFYKAQVVSVSDYYSFGMVIKEREWRAPLGDTAKYIDVEFDNEPYNSGTEQLLNGNIKTLNSTSWDNGGHSQQSFSGDCKVVWRNPNSNTNEKSYVGLSYNDYTSYTGISYYIFSRFYDTKYKYAYPFSGSLTSSVDIEVGDQAVIERKDGVIYMYIIRANGARVDIGNWTETSPGSAMKMAYTSYELGAILSLKFYKLEKPSFGYRFGFNGKEQDNGVSGQGNSYDYGMRIYNPRLAKFFSTDPLEGGYPYLSPYHYAHNSPIRCIDLDGLEGKLSVQSDLISNNGMPSMRASTGALIQAVVVEVGLEALATKAKSKSYSFAFKALKDGKLYGTDGKLYTTKRLATYEKMISDGITYTNVEKGVNFGYKIGDELVTTAGLDQFKMLRKTNMWNGLKKLAKHGWLADFAGMAIAFSEGDVGKGTPLGFMNQDIYDNLDDIVRQQIYRDMNKAMDGGLETVKTFAKKQFAFADINGFETFQISDGDMAKIFSGEHSKYDQLYVAAMNYSSSEEYSENGGYTIFVENRNGETIIRGIFKNDLTLDDNTSTSEESSSETTTTTH